MWEYRNHRVHVRFCKSGMATGLECSKNVALGFQSAGLECREFEKQQICRRTDDPLT